MQNQIKDMFQLQNKLNNETNGTDWVNGITNKGKVINWDRAITLELAECIDSFPWKHWKGIEQQPDISNARIELVDVWHFLMSSIIETQAHSLNFKNQVPDISDSALNELQNKYDLFRTTEGLLINHINVNYDFIANIFEEYERETFKGYSKYYENEWVLETHKEINIVLSLVEETLAISALLNKFKLVFLSNPTQENISNVMEYTQRLTIAFVAACSSLNLSFEDLNKQYLGKNALNGFRQDHGYKEGTYIKVWNGEEDNVHMLRIIDELGTELTYEAIYNGLENIYKTLKG
jgi:dimeric dUTPase (all-alpha-NTP-PPase superfamily)